jgi:hypothetical protein
MAARKPRPGRKNIEATDFITNIEVTVTTRNAGALCRVEPQRRSTMPMLFWLPAIMVGEMWLIAWSEMPAMIPRPVPVP